MGLKKTDDEIAAEEEAAEAAFATRFEKALTGESFKKFFNNAITAREKRQNDALSKLLDEKFKALTPPPGDDDGEGDDDTPVAPIAKPKGQQRPPAASGGITPEVQRAIDSANRAAKAATDALAEEKKKREEAEAKRAHNEERLALTEALAAAGVTKEMIPVAISHLHGEEKRLARGEDGKIYWKDGDEELEVGKGVESWAKSPLGQRFLPARDVAGSGTGPANPGRRGKDGKVEYSDADLGGMLKGL